MKERRRIHQELEKIEGVRPFPSVANFLLCQWKKTGDMDDLMGYLLSNGIYVRDCRNFPGLEKGFFRVGIRRTEENGQLLSLLSRFCSLNVKAGEAPLNDGS